MAGCEDYLDDESTLEESGRVGSLTNEKWENYGTREAVDKSRSQIAQRSLQQMAVILQLRVHIINRRKHRPYNFLEIPFLVNYFDDDEDDENDVVHNVTAHISRIYTEALCKFPKPKIIPIVAASKTYVPHCTVLHRCGDDTGCCHTDALTCVPKRTATVDLYFYVSTMEKREPSVEYLTFINHTECHCLSRHNPANLHRNNPYNVSPTTASSSSTVTENNCRCVRHFTVFHERVESEEDEGLAKTRCRCDCEPDNVNCDWLKRGMDGFSIENRRCIEDRRCSRPTCQYGQYNTTIGRCPKVEDKLADARKSSFNETSRLRFD
ncbi:hypothetical protein HA402_011037 [Bradysia odoriphaga]|nr:hypothetical protein HA402_011037 [Bradysia odoriphaga]